MNWDYKMTQRTFKQNPLLSSRQYSSIFIMLAAVGAVKVGFDLVMHLTNEPYDPVLGRGKLPLDNKYGTEPYVIPSFEIDKSFVAKDRTPEEIAKYAEENVDKLHLGNQVFLPNLAF